MSKTTTRSPTKGTASSSKGKGRGAKPEKAPKLIPDLSHEQIHWERGLRLIAGTDECGRGPLSGPVFAGAAILHPEARLEKFAWVRDSKTLTERKIIEAAELIRSGALEADGLLAWGLGAASPREIDRINIRRASILAMARSIENAEKKLRKLGHLSPDGKVEYVLVDGLPTPELGREHDALVKGDSRSISIAIGALLAKFHRDQLMIRLSERYPQYACWASDKGYPSPSHMAALAEHGPILKIHRMSFSPIAQRSLF